MPLWGRRPPTMLPAGEIDSMLQEAYGPRLEAMGFESRARRS